MCKQKDFLDAQIHRIEVDKWCQGERQHSDPGEDYVLDWVYQNAKQFRDDWNMSLCQTCSNQRKCGHNVLSACDQYQEMEYYADEKDFMS